MRKIRAGLKQSSLQKKRTLHYLLYESLTPNIYFYTLELEGRERNL